MKISTEFLKTTARDFLTSVKALVFLLILLLILVGIWLSVDIYNKASESENTITVSATSEVYAKPDLAITTFSVVTEAKTVAEAMSKNTERMNAVVSFVKGQGVEDKDMKTIGFNVYPRYDWCDRASSVIPCPSSRILVGYEVNQSLQLKIRDLDSIGKLIQGATDNGVNQVSSLQFTIDNEDALREEARGKAIKEAKEKAKTLASQVGIRLVRIINFNEGGQTPIRYYSMDEAMEGGKGGGAPEIETGENKISVTVSITYQIR